MTTRRELMQWTAASLGVIASDLARATDDDLPKPLSILFLGGTGFLGPVQVEYALARGHRVTLFNRGVEGWPSPEKEREALAQLIAARG